MHRTCSRRVLGRGPTRKARGLFCLPGIKLGNPALPFMKPFLLLFVFGLSASLCGTLGCNKKEDARGPAQNPPADAGQDKAAAENKDKAAADDSPRKIIYAASIRLLVADFAKAEKELLELV